MDDIPDDIPDDLSHDLSDDLSSDPSDDLSYDDVSKDPEKIDIAKGCEWLEGSPKIKWGSVCVYTQVRGQYVSMEVDCADDNYDIIFRVSDQLFAVDEWRSFGRAVRNCTWNVFELQRRMYETEDDITGDPAAAARCINAFVAEMKYNTTIETVTTELSGLSMNDLGEFIQNNKVLKTLRLSSREPVSLENSSLLSRAISIRNGQLERVNIQDCCFENDGAFEQMLEGCSRVGWLSVPCGYNWQCTAVAAFLRDPENVVIRKLSLDVTWRSLDSEQAWRDILASLVGNSHLRELSMYNFEDAENRFDKLLCDISSIESIANSNHTLEKIMTSDINPSLFTRQCLALNKNTNKAQVIRYKIFCFYFVEDFDVAPFSSMAVSVVPKVMSQIRKENKHSAIYRLLQCLPELCNISDRVSCGQHGGKRLKRSFDHQTST